jgi:hypothetical protein
MMDNLEGKILFVVDYRSPPSGCGVIEGRDKSLLLLQHAGCKPEVMEGAYDGVFCIERDLGEEYEKGSEEVIEILLREGVEYVYDPKFGEQHEIGSGYIEIKKYIELTRFYY